MNQSVNNKKLYDFSDVKSGFMNNSEWQISIERIISQLENSLKVKNELDNLYDDLVSISVQEMDRFVNFKEVSKKHRKKFKHSKPYWSYELALAWKNMVKSEKLYRKFKGHRHTKILLRNDFLTNQRNFDKMLKKSERNYNYSFLKKFEDISTNNPKEFWAKLKSLGPKQNKLPNKVYKDGVLTSDPDYVRHKWKHDFKNLYNPTLEKTTTQIDFETEIKRQKETLENCLNSENEKLNTEISMVEISLSLAKCKCKKATGVDKIPNELIKNDNFKRILYKLFNVCFINHVVPNLWAKAIIKPIPKSSDKDPHMPVNYRGISLLSCIGKLYSNILNTRLNEFLESKNIIVDEQNGFRKNRSCEDHIFSLSSVINNRMLEKKQTFAAFIDMNKAFDCINRDFLYYKLLHNNITGNIYYAIKAVYSNTLSAVLVNDVLTDWFITESGVRQGDNLSPTLFALYVNDLALEINAQNLGVEFDNSRLSILLYADDIVLISENEKNLQKMLKLVDKWCSKWQMKVNISKTKVIHFRKIRKNETKYKFKIGENEIEKVACYKYLGVLFDQHLTFKNCAESLSESAGRALSSIISKLQQFTFSKVNFESFTKIFTSCVRPILDYGASIWGFNNERIGQRIQDRAVRYYLGVHRFTPILGLHSEMGWLNIKFHFLLCMLRYWNRLMKMDSCRLTRKIFEYDFTHIKSANWSGKILFIAEKLQMEDVLIKGETFDLKYVQEKLLCLMQEEWANKIPTLPKLRYYVKFKSDIVTASYLKANITRTQRSLLAQL